MLKVIKENKILSIYSGILILLVVIIIGSIMFTTSTGSGAFYQRMIAGIFCLVLGVPLTLMILPIFVAMVINVWQSFPTYLMKRKRKFTKRGKILFKRDASVVGISLFGLLVVGGFCFAGGYLSINCIKDYHYLDHPESVELVDWQVTRTSTRHSYVGRSYRLKGVDYNGDEYSFNIGKYPSMVLPDDTTGSLQVYYLPYNEVVMEIK